MLISVESHSRNCIMMFCQRANRLIQRIYFEAVFTAQHDRLVIMKLKRTRLLKNLCWIGVSGALPSIGP